MLIKIADPTNQTVLFLIIFVGLLLVSIKRNKDQAFFSKEVTNQLKGFAIFTVVFSHIGYFLSSDNRFLYPLSIAGGVGVNLFLFLSGFGLTLSHLKSPLPTLSFYKKRLVKLFIPLWVVLSILLIADFLLFKRTYSLSEIINSFLGFYPRADLWQNLDSPLWYFSIILFYYLLFPLLFIKKFPFVSPFLILLTSLLVLNLPLFVNIDVLKLYKLHYLAFPIGMLFALTAQKIKINLSAFLKILILLIFIPIVLYTSIHSGVGQNIQIEQGISLITTISLVITFLFSGVKFNLLSIFGVYSYEIYLLHWPILSRYNLFLSLPPFLMVIANIVLVFIFSFLLQKLDTLSI